MLLHDTHDGLFRHQFTAFQQLTLYLQPRSVTPYSGLGGLVDNACSESWRICTLFRRLTWWRNHGTCGDILLCVCVCVCVCVCARARAVVWDQRATVGTHAEHINQSFQPAKHIPFMLNVWFILRKCNGAAINSGFEKPRRHKAIPANTNQPVVWWILSYSWHPVRYAAFSRIHQ
jgi:hypothetical protein